MDDDVVRRRPAPETPESLPTGTWRCPYCGSIQTEDQEKCGYCGYLRMEGRE